MASVTRKQIMPFTNLTCVKTNKFKTGCLSITLITQLSRETASKNALLPKVLRRGSAQHPDMESIASALDGLYGARIEPTVRKKGELHCIGFYADFINDEFVPDGDHILEKTAALMGEILLNPNTRGGQLNGEYVDGERELLIDEIHAGINEKRRYSIDRLIELMCNNEAYGTNKLGSESSAKSITSAGLTKHYKKIISTALIEVFYCGSAEFERVSEAVQDALSPLPRTEQATDLLTDVKLRPESTEPRIFTDQLDVTQGKLAIGFRLGESMTSPNYAALMVFNAVFGGSVTSKLFLNVREKLSLCYFASSMIEKHKGVMVVSSGIDFDKYDDALAEILSQLNSIKQGEISDWELQSAKRAVITSVKTGMDKLSELEDMYFDQSISEIKCSPDELAALADIVTKEEIQNIAAGIETDTIYFLTGNGGSAHEA